MKTKIHQSYLTTALCLLTVSILAKNNNEIVATINTGVSPSGIAITPDGRTGYVANSNFPMITGASSVSILDLKNNLLISTLEDPSFVGPHTVTMGMNGTKAYVTNFYGTTISVINTATNTVSAVIGGFDAPSAMVITPAGNKAYVSNYNQLLGSAGTIRVVDLNTNTIIGTPIEVGEQPSDLALSPNGDFLYVINFEDGAEGAGTMDVIRTSDNTIVSILGGFSGPSHIALSASGKRAYITNYGNNSAFGTTVSVVDLEMNQIIDTLEVGIQPSGVAVGNNCLVYVTNANTVRPSQQDFPTIPGQGTVSIINTKNNSVVAPTIPVGGTPLNITLSPNGRYAYVSNYSSNTISVIKLKK